VDGVPYTARFIPEDRDGVTYSIYYGHVRAHPVPEPEKVWGEWIPRPRHGETGENIEKFDSIMKVRYPEKFDAMMRERAKEANRWNPRNGG